MGRKKNGKINKFFGAMAAIDGATLSAAQDTEWIIKDLRKYIGDINGALKKVGSKASMEKLRVGPDETGEYDLVLSTALVLGDKSRWYFEFEFDMENKGITASVTEPGKISCVDCFKRPYYKSEEIKKSLNMWVRDALPSVDRANLVATGAGVRRPKLS